MPHMRRILGKNRRKIGLAVDKTGRRPHLTRSPVSGPACYCYQAMTKKTGKRQLTHFEQIPVEIVKKITLEKPSPKKPTGPRNVVAEPTAQKTEPYSMPLSSLCWTGH
jgi:hypothetical protein